MGNQNFRVPILFSVAIVSLLIGVKKREVTPLPLVSSLPLLDYDQAWGKLLFTENLICVVRLDDCDANTCLAVVRMPMFEHQSVDTFHVPITENLDGLDLYRFLNRAQVLGGLNRSSLVILPFPLGDTGEMIRMGKVESLRPRFVSEKELNRYLSVEHALSYIVDIQSTPPRTLAAIRGRLIQYCAPYLSFVTNYGYDTLLLNDSVMLSRVIIPQEDFSIKILDLEAMQAAVHQEVEFTIWFLARMIDDHLIYTSDKMENEAVFSTSSTYLLDSFEVIDWDLRSGKKTLSHALVPSGAWSDIMGERQSDLPTNTDYALTSPQGELLILESPSYWGRTWDAPRLKPGTVRPFAVSNISALPYEVTWIKQVPGFKNLNRWWISPGRRWLVLELQGKWKKNKEIVLAPLRVLFDSTALQPENLVRITGLSARAKVEFVPGDNWLLISQKGTLRLYRCDGKASPIRLGANNERINLLYDEVIEIFFSPDGRYMGYVCRIEGKEGQWLQVRRLPE